MRDHEWTDRKVGWEHESTKGGGRMFALCTRRRDVVRRYKRQPGVERGKPFRLRARTGAGLSGKKESRKVAEGQMTLRGRCLGALALDG